MRNIFQILITVFTLSILTNCGLKGPLYFPPENELNQY